MPDRGEIQVGGRTLFSSEAKVRVPANERGLGMVFLRDEGVRARIEAACEAEGIGVAGWRPVPRLGAP